MLSSSAFAFTTSYNDEFGHGLGIRHRVATDAASTAKLQFGDLSQGHPLWGEKLSCVHRVLGANRSAATLFLPGTLKYNQTLFIDNARVVWLPRFVVSPRDEHDIVAAMRAAQDCQLHFSVVSGGHSAQGYGLAQGGLTLNMRSLNASHFHHVPNTEGEANSTKTVVTIGAGSRFAEIYETLYRRGKGEIIVAGGCPQVGAGGFIQGGGWSFLSRSYGLAIDQLVRAKVVLPNLTVATLSATHPDQDLWWAVRGGGGGNWGVVTEFTTNVHHPERLATNGQICWDPLSPRIRPMMEVWIDLWPTMPDWLAMIPSWIPLGPNHTRLFCFTVICNNVAEKCDPWLAPLKANQPVLNTLRIIEFVKWSKEHVNVTAAQEGYLYLKSYGFKRVNFTIDLVDILIEAVRSAPSSRNLILFHVAGGAINRVPTDATAFPHRDLMMLMQIKAIWNHPSQEAENNMWINNVSSQVQSGVSGAYVNYIDAELADWQTAYYGESGYQRLKKIKARVDPDNFFFFNQSVGSMYQPEK